MPTIAFASFKGGVGKSTSSVLFACELARRTSVAILDGDPNKPIVRWANKPGCPDSITVQAVDENSIIDVIDEAAQRVAFVLVDLEGARSHMVALAMSRSDLVVIPLQGSELDAVEALNVVRYLSNQTKAFRRPIPFRLLYTRTPAALRPDNLKMLESEMLERGYPAFGHTLNERNPYRTVFTNGGTLYDLPSNHSVRQAITNVRELTAELVAVLRTKQEARA